jgi:hypothetical protein
MIAARHTLTWLRMVVAVVSVQALAQDTPTPPAPPPLEPSAQQAPPPVEGPAQPPKPAPLAALTNVVTRDPFLPVGYVPPSPSPIPTTPSLLSGAPVSAAPQAPRTIIEWPTLKVRGVTRGSGGRQIALIDGVGLAETGSVIHMPVRGVTYSWRVVRIEGTEVQFERLAAEPTVRQDGGR